MDLTFPVKNITILNNGGPDKVLIECKGVPNPFPALDDYNLILSFECLAGLGIQYLADISRGNLKPNNLVRTTTDRLMWNDKSQIPFEKIKRIWQKEN